MDWLPEEEQVAPVIPPLEDELEDELLELDDDELELLEDELLEVVVPA